MMQAFGGSPFGRWEMDREREKERKRGKEREKVAEWGHVLDVGALLLAYWTWPIFLCSPLMGWAHVELVGFKLCWTRSLLDIS